MWLTSQDTIKYELSKKETKACQEFRDEVNNIKAAELKARENADPDTDYLSKRSKPTDYGITLSFVEGYIGYTVYVECPGLGLKKNITDYDQW